MNLKNKLLDFFFKNGKSDRQEAGESDTYFLERLTTQEKESIIKLGDEFIDKTDLIRADFYYRMKDAILDKNNDEFKGFEPRSLNYMLERVISFDATLVKELEESLTNQDKSV